MRSMPTTPSPLAELSTAIAAEHTDAPRIARNFLAHANSNAGANVYLALDSARVLREAEQLDARFPTSAQRPSLYGVPISIKDCFDIAGYPTTCGSRFYAEQNGIAAQDSAVAARLRAQGALLTGKTHLHQLAYGITGENADFGDCVQPRNAAWLTGGSSSGAAASVQEGSALAAIGTDTGGSIRVPAALCGLAGYRSSHGLANSLGLWRGAMHLAPSFDTLGWLFRDLRDAPLLAQSLFGIEVPSSVPDTVKIGYVGPEFLHDCEASVLAAYASLKLQLQASGAEISAISTTFWVEAMDIFAPIQANEAAAIHRGNFQHFEASIAERLAWGASISEDELGRLRHRHAIFRERMDRLLDGLDFLIAPCAPMATLLAGADHSSTRKAILRYTSPISLAGMPAVAVPCESGGVQLIAARGHDARLLAYAAKLGGESQS